MPADLGTALGLGAAFLVVCALSLVTAFTDAPNAVALAARFRALTPRIAVQTAALMNLLGVIVGTVLLTYNVRFFFQAHGHGVVGLLVLTVGALVAALWGLLLWWRRVPGSTTHAMLAGLWGASFAAHVSAGVGDPAAMGPQMREQLVFGLLLTPVLALLSARLLVPPIVRLGSTGSTVRVQRRARISLSIASSATAFGHGIQSGQRIGLLWGAAVLAADAVHHEVPSDLPLDETVVWAPLLAFALCSAFGFLGGSWRIGRTMTERLVSLDPLRAAVASASAAGWLFFGSILLHVPISSTHTTVASTVGAGQDQRFHSVRWGQVFRVAGWWLATPAVCLGAAFGLTGLALAFT